MMKLLRGQCRLQKRKLFFSILLLSVLGVGATVWAGTTIQVTVRRSASLDNGLIAHYTLDGKETDVSSADGSGWTRATASANWSARTRAQATLSYDGRLWIIGGWDGANTIGDVWYSTNGSSWTRATNNPAFGAKATHEALVFDGRMWVIGGGNNEVWYSYDGATWTRATSNAGWGGSFRNQHAVTVFDGRMWMMGGTNGTDQNDVWYSYDGATWTRATSSAGWSARQGHRVVTYNGKMWLVGGSSSSDVWSSTDGISWTQETSNGGWGSSSRRSHAMVVYDNKMWVIGGYDGNTFTSGVWWSEDGINWNQSTSSPGWAARAEHGAVVHDGRIWVMGGMSSSNFRDVWYTSLPGNSVVGDSSGNNNHGTYVGNGGQRYELGRIGQALRFDGETDHITVGNISASARTISFWIKPETAGSTIRLSSSASVSVGGSATKSIQYLGSSTGTTTATLPTHQTGDLLLAFAYRDGNTTPPTLPSGWINIANSGANSNSSRIAYRIASSPGTSSGTWTNATSVVFHAYRGVDQSTPIGGNGSAGTRGTSITYPSLTMSVIDGSSWVAGFAGHRNTNTALENPPSGMVNRSNVVDATDEASGHDTNGGVLSWSNTSVAVGGTSRGWRAQTVEIVAAAPPGLSIETAGITSPTVYVNGVVGSQLQAEVWQHVVITSSTAIAVSDLEIGRSGSSYFKGGIDDVRLYGQVLAADEINRVYHLGATTVINKTLNRTSLDNGLVLHYSFDGTSVSGGTVTDVSGSGRNGSYSTGGSGPEGGLGRIGQGMMFNGTAGSNMVTVPNHGSLNIGTGSFTVGAWVKSNRFVGDYDMPIYKGGASSGDPGWGFELGRDVWGFGISNGSSSPPQIFFNDNGWSGPFLQNGQWYHLVAVVDRSNNRVRTYRDGQLVGNEPAPTGNISSSQSLTLGGRSHVDPQPFDGVVDDLRIYSRALSDAEVERVYHLGATTKLNIDTGKSSAGLAMNNGLVAKWTFDGPDVDGSTIREVVNGNDGVASVSGGGSIEFVPGRIGQAIRFNSPARVTVPYNATLNPRSAVTYSAWINWNGSNGQLNSLQNIITNGTWNRSLRLTESGHWITQAGKLLLNVGIGSDGVEAYSAGVIRVGEWEHVAATYDGSAVRLFINGEPVITSIYVNYNLVSSPSFSGQLPNGTGSTFIGAESAGNDADNFNGRVDDVRIYDRALSEEEVRLLFETGNR